MIENSFQRGKHFMFNIISSNFERGWLNDKVQNLLTLNINVFFSSANCNDSVIGKKRKFNKLLTFHNLNSHSTWDNILIYLGFAILILDKTVLFFFLIGARSFGPNDTWFYCLFIIIIHLWVFLQESRTIKLCIWYTRRHKMIAW